MGLRRSGGIAGPPSACWPRLPWYLRKVRLRRKDGIGRESVRSTSGPSTTTRTTASRSTSCGTASHP